MSWVTFYFRNDMCLRVSVYEILFLRKAMMWFFMTDILVRHPTGRCYATLKNTPGVFL
ncbi:hypothetical protein Q7O_003267 [Pectobacterium carotovorum subsp. carotovorum PCCS1]|nr:hypothetical protein [Pectobacterium carotovorum subsp. carotovorum PCCS1]